MLDNNPSCIGNFDDNCSGKSDNSIGIILYIKSMGLDYYYVLVMLNMS